MEHKENNNYRVVLERGHVVKSGNFKLVRKITSLDEFWHVINSQKSLFARHRVYPSAFFLSWQIKTVNSWIGHDTMSLKTVILD